MTENISRSEVKRQFKQTEQVAAELADFTENDLKKLPCSDELKQEIRATRGLKGGSRKRQVKYLAKLMRQQPLTEIYDFLEERKGSDLKTRKTFHEAERLRDAMINEAVHSHDQCRQNQHDWEMDWRSDEITGVVKRYPDLKEGDIRKVVYSYVKTRNRLHYRELFRMVKAAIDQDNLRERLA